MKHIKNIFQFLTGMFAVLGVVLLIKNIVDNIKYEKKLKELQELVDFFKDEADDKLEFVVVDDTL